MEEQKNQEQNQASNPASVAGAPESSDAEKNKLMAIVGYILPILFFVPLINEASKNSPFAKFHANQQLVLLIAAIVVDIVGSIIPLIGWFIILPLGTVAIVVLAILGIVSASKGETKPLPMIGGFKII
ncbi:MAG: DUF4870 domain-containing protein [Parcubacteria group bacterium]